MGGLARALGRLLIMGAVMAGVVVACLIAGIGTTIALALGIVLAGLVGLAGVVRRDTAASGSAAAHEQAGQAGREVRAASASTSPMAGIAAATGQDAMDPAEAAMFDPEANMPRWRRPSLLEARRSDPRQRTASPHTPQRFSDEAVLGELRRIRYAVVPVLDQPDEVLGRRLADLGNGDEIQVVGAAGTFLEVICPTGVRGWIHRTTVSQPVGNGSRPDVPAEAEDALTALLAARGLQ
jgi:hypothetical protein